MNRFINMSHPLNFKISSALKDIIGRDLITDDYIAIFELVKNSYDAHATKVEIVFENIYNSENAKIIIKDNGKGMDFNDLKDKWLFVAYSAKKEGTEDKDYRNRIQQNIHYAGAKGIGRFSCDRLGKLLKLESTKRGGNRTEILETNWEAFEGSIRKEFVDIEVTHTWKKQSSFGLHQGTVLEIQGLRSEWDRNKLLKLKDSLAKLINPNRGKGEHKFAIYIEVQEEEEQDRKETENYKIVNGEVQNFIFETLGLKTTKIHASISADKKFITTELRDGGTLIYKITEHNKFTLLDKVDFTIYYLNMSAKLTFTRRMGLPSNQYGHIFLYKNGFRVYPYGEPGEDPLKIDVRKAQGHSRYLGTRELIGQIEIFSSSEQLKETSSRGDGLLKTKSYYQLEDCFWEVLKRLEKYVVEVQQWGVSIEDENSLDVKSRASDLLAKLTGTEHIIDFETEDNFIEILESSQYNSAEAIVKNLNKIALETGDNKLIEQARKASGKLNQIQKAKEEAERLAEQEFERAEEATEKLKEQISENLFLKSINTNDFQEIISLLHHIGIYAGTIDNNLKGISLRVQNNIPLTKEDLNNIIRTMSFETKKILNVVAFATKANFKLKTEQIEVDLNNYIREYIQNIIPSITDKDLKIKVKSSTEKPFIKDVKPIEINIVIDNLINNAKKAGSTELDIVFSESEKGNFQVKFIDNGSGIKEENLKRIYDFGFTTTDGSGIGLYHVKEIMKSIGGLISAENNIDSNGVTFNLEFK